MTHKTIHNLIDDDVSALDDLMADGSQQESVTVTVTISDDPSSLGCEATADDLETYRGRLEQRLNDAFELFDIEVRTGDQFTSTATHPAVEELLEEIERGNVWSDLMDDPS